MGVMEKMRGTTKYILWLLIFSFGILWALADTQVFDAINAGPQAMGEVNGEKISIREYNQKVQTFTEQHRNRTGESVTPELRTYYEQQAWEELVQNILIEQKMEELGITVTDQELVDMITGPNPDPFIAQQFRGEDGQINRAALNQAIQSEQNTRLWIMIEQQLRDKRRREKLSNYLSSSVMVTNTDIENAYISQNSSVTFDYVRVPYSTITDSMLTYSEGDLQDYYDENVEDYKRKKSWDISYVQWDKTPTPADTNRIYEEVRSIRDDFAETEDDSLFFLRWESDTEYNPSFVAKSDVKELYQPVLDLQVGEVTDIIVDDQDQLHLVKKLAERGNEVKFADYTRAIVADPINTLDALAREADDFRYFAGEEGFEGEANRRELMIRDAQATDGTPFIPGLGQSRQVMNFLENTKKDGAISEVIELPQKFVIVKVNDITEKGYRPFNEVKQQVENAYKNELRREQVVARLENAITAGDLQSIASQVGTAVATAESITYDAQFVPNAGQEPRLVGAARGLDVNQVSSVVEGQSAGYVLKVSNKNEADLSGLNQQVRNQIEQELQQQKQQALVSVWTEKLKENAEIADYRHLFK